MLKLLGLNRLLKSGCTKVLAQAQHFREINWSKNLRVKFLKLSFFSKQASLTHTQTVGQQTQFRVNVFER